MTATLKESVIFLYGAIIAKLKETFEPGKQILIEDALDAFIYENSGDHNPEKEVKEILAFYEKIDNRTPLEEHHLQTLKAFDNHKCQCKTEELKLQHQQPYPYCPTCRQLKLSL